MNNTEHEMINGLFTRLKQADNNTAPRDEMAEKLIKEHIEKHPEAPYYMVQVILIQEEAIKKLNEHISNLEKYTAESKDKGKGFLSKLFGINESFDKQRSSSNSKNQIPVGSYGKTQKNTNSIPSSTPISSSQNISFLNSALRTAVGVAGGVMIGDMLRNLVNPSLSEEIIDVNTDDHISSTDHVNNHDDTLGLPPHPYDDDDNDDDDDDISVSTDHDYSEDDDHNFYDEEDDLNYDNSEDDGTFM